MTAPVDGPGHRAEAEGGAAAVASRGRSAVSSVAALTGGVIGPHYAASKAALHGLHGAGDARRTRTSPAR